MNYVLAIHRHGTTMVMSIGAQLDIGTGSYLLLTDIHEAPRSDELASQIKDMAILVSKSRPHALSFYRFIVSQALSISHMRFLCLLLS